MRLRIEPVASDGTAKLHFEHDNSSASAPLPKEYYFSKHEETAAVRVQSHARSHHVKKEVKKMKKAATRVQAVSRGHAAKKHVKEKKRVVAAQRIAVEVLQEDVLEAHISRNDVVSRPRVRLSFDLVDVDTRPAVRVGFSMREFVAASPKRGSHAPAGQQSKRQQGTAAAGGGGGVGAMSRGSGVNAGGAKGSPRRGPPNAKPNAAAQRESPTGRKGGGGGGGFNRSPGGGGGGSKLPGGSRSPGAVNKPGGGPATKALARGKGERVHVAESAATAKRGVGDTGAPRGRDGGGAAAAARTADVATEGVGPWAEAPASLDPTPPPPNVTAGSRWGALRKVHQRASVLSKVGSALDPGVNAAKEAETLRAEAREAANERARHARDKAEAAKRRAKEAAEAAKAREADAQEAAEREAEQQAIAAQAIAVRAAAAAADAAAEAGAAAVRLQAMIRGWRERSRQLMFAEAKQAAAAAEEAADAAVREAEEAEELARINDVEEDGVRRYLQAKHSMAQWNAGALKGPKPTLPSIPDTPQCREAIDKYNLVRVFARGPSKGLSLQMRPSLPVASRSALAHLHVVSLVSALPPPPSPLPPPPLSVLQQVLKHSKKFTSRLLSRSIKKMDEVPDVNVRKFLRAKLNQYKWLQGFINGEKPSLPPLPDEAFAQLGQYAYLLAQAKRFTKRVMMQQQEDTTEIVFAPAAAATACSSSPAAAVSGAGQSDDSPKADGAGSLAPIRSWRADYANTNGSWSIPPDLRPPGTPFFPLRGLPPLPTDYKPFVSYQSPPPSRASARVVKPTMPAPEVWVVAAARAELAKGSLSARSTRSAAVDDEEGFRDGVGVDERGRPMGVPMTRLRDVRAYMSTHMLSKEMPWSKYYRARRVAKGGRRRPPAAHGGRTPRSSSVYGGGLPALGESLGSYSEDEEPEEGAGPGGHYYGEDEEEVEARWLHEGGSVSARSRLQPDRPRVIVSNEAGGAVRAGNTAGASTHFQRLPAPPTSKPSGTGGRGKRGGDASRRHGRRGGRGGEGGGRTRGEGEREGGDYGDIGAAWPTPRGDRVGDHAALPVSKLGGQPASPRIASVDRPSIHMKKLAFERARDERHNESIKHLLTPVLVRGEGEEPAGGHRRYGQHGRGVDMLQLAHQGFEPINTNTPEIVAGVYENPVHHNMHHLYHPTAIPLVPGQRPMM